MRLARDGCHKRRLWRRRHSHPTRWTICETHKHLSDDDRQHFYLVSFFFYLVRLSLTLAIIIRHNSIYNSMSPSYFTPPCTPVEWAAGSLSNTQLSATHKSYKNHCTLSWNWSAPRCHNQDASLLEGCQGGSCYTPHSCDLSTCLVAGQIWKTAVYDANAILAIGVGPCSYLATAAACKFVWMCLYGVVGVKEGCNLTPFLL